MKNGDDYSLLKKCVAISILDFNLTNRKEYHQTYRLRDEHGYEFSDVLEIHILELRKKLRGTGEMEEWIQFFRADSEEDLNMIGTKNPGILEAIREVREMSLSRRLRLRHEAHLKQIRDEKAWKTYEREEARKEGLAEGRAEGLTEGRGQIIRNMIHQNISDADILCLSGCTETELEEIKKNMEPQEMQHSRNKAGT
jgi:predicted transposase/invertase (TIGR01784 family)